MSKKNSVHVHILQASGHLNTFLQEITSRVDQAVSRVLEKLLFQPIDLVIFDNPDETIPGFGQGGRMYTPHVITIALDPSFSNFPDIIQNDLPRTIAHELHHAARGQSVGYGKTLREALVSEGLASHFEEEVFSGDAYPWSTAVTEREAHRFLEQAKKESGQLYDHGRWFYGRGDLPRWIGYTVGYILVKDYLQKHGDETPATLYGIGADIFFGAD